MISDDIAKQLHDKATRGRQLTLEEKSFLETWYRLQDIEEENILESKPDKFAPTSLYAQIEETLSQITAISESIRKVSSENESLKEEIAVLQSQLKSDLITELA